VLAADRLGDARLDLLDLLASPGASGLETLELPPDARRRHAEAHVADPARDDERLADPDSR
jgi:hypothetical protein